MKEKHSVLFLLMYLLLQVPLFTHSQDLADAITSAKYHDAGIYDYRILPVDTLRLRIIEKARQYIGVDYKWGESGENGFDCSGYVKYIFGQFGYALPHSSLAQYNKSKRLVQSKARPGDLVFFITSGNKISHVGIYLGNNKFIHAPRTGRQVRVESIDTGFFRKALAGFGTIF